MISDRSFEHKVVIAASKLDEVERFLSQELGPRLYYMHRQRGGKKWLIRTGRVNILPQGHIVEVEDGQIATLLSLKFL